MCGVCAKSFSSLEAAEKHEDYHVKEVVEDLGWSLNFKDNSIPEIFHNTQQNADHRATPIRSTDTIAQTQEYTDTPTPNLQRNAAGGSIGFHKNTPIISNMNPLYNGDDNHLRQRGLTVPRIDEVADHGAKDILSKSH